MVRQLLTNKQIITDIVKSIARPRVIQGFLVDKYLGYSGEILVQITDPNRGTRGTIMKARIRPGVVLPSINSGTPVAVQISHGQAEIIGLSSSGVV